MIDEYSYILENLVTVFTGIMVHVGIYVCVMKHFVVVRKIVCIHQIEIICDKPALVMIQCRKYTLIKRIFFSFIVFYRIYLYFGWLVLH